MYDCGSRRTHPDSTCLVSRQTSILASNILDPQDWTAVGQHRSVQYLEDQRAPSFDAGVTQIQHGKCSWKKQLSFQDADVNST